MTMKTILSIIRTILGPPPQEDDRMPPPPSTAT